MKAKNIQIRDPFILNHRGRYYLTGSTDKDIWKGSGTGFDIYISDDLEEWMGPVPAFRPPQGFWGTKNFWAPEIYAYDGSFFMFASFIGDDTMRGTAILKADKPEGPYLPWSEGAVTPSDSMCLDGTLHVDEAGKPWMVYCHEWVQIGDGQICAVRLRDDLKCALTDPVSLFSSSQATWSKKAFSPSNNMEGHVTDGCFLHRLANGKLVMIWSCIGEKGYCLGYAVSESGSILGPWVQAEDVLFAEDGGHGMIFRTNEGRLFLTVHAPNDSPNERMVLNEIAETDDGLRLR